MREAVTATDRKSMHKQRRLRIYVACDGRCVCGVKVPLDGTVVDHEKQIWLGSDDAEDDSNCRFLCADCDKEKTRLDAGVRAKVKRIIRQNDPETRKRSNLKGRPFQTKLTKTFNGKVRPRG